MTSRPTPASEHVLSELLYLLNTSGDEVDRIADDVLANWYTPRTELAGELAELEKLIDRRDGLVQRARDRRRTKGARADASKQVQEMRQDVGDALERVAALLFAGIEGYTDMQHIQTRGEQYDLLVDGSSIKWHIICHLLGLTPGRTDFVVEAKNWTGPANIETVVRVGALLINCLPSAALGIVMSPKGLTGDAKGVLIGGREHQALFYARHGIPIVCLTLSDLRECVGDDGSLLRVLRRRIKAVEQRSTPRATASGLNEPVYHDLPGPLQRLIAGP